MASGGISNAPLEIEKERDQVVKKYGRGLCLSRRWMGMGAIRDYSSFWIPLEIVWHVGCDG